MSGLTDAQVEAEIERLKNSEDVKLARRYAAYQNRRRQWLYTMRSLEKKGKALREAGYTMENLNELLTAEENMDGEEA